MGLVLSIDSGGTKTSAVLFDRDFRLVAAGRGGGANANFDSPETILAHLREGLEPCLQACEGCKVERAYITSLGAFDRIVAAIREFCDLGEAIAFGEADACIRACLGRREGVVALAGTGAFVAGLRDGRMTGLGGWGSWIGDEGSGYDIGRRAIGAAIRHVEGRGPETALTEAIVGHFGMSRLHDLFTELYGAPSVRAFISSVAPLVPRAALAGDSAAVRILTEAGRELGEMTAALRRREAALRALPVTVAGSVWKGSPHMFDSFVGTLRAAEPDCVVTLPKFEPVMGGVVEDALRAQESGKATVAQLERESEAEMDASPDKADIAPRLDDAGDAPLLLEAEFDRFRYRLLWSEAAR